MNSFLYNGAKELMWGAGLNVMTNTIKAALIDTDDYTGSAAHSAYSTDVPAAAKVAEFTLASKSITDGKFDAADGVFPSLTGDPSEAIIIYDSDNDRLIAYIDGDSISLTPNGNNVTCTWNAAGIAYL